jgi:Cdc6-like AAA superfamily ATPase
MQDVISVVSQQGQHVALYGERGVGKTSLANVLAEVFDAAQLPSFQAAMVNCSTNDDFLSVWNAVFRRLGVEGIENASPEEVRFVLDALDPPALIVIDELDRLEDDESLTLLADTIKTLSDHVVPSTLVLVGVADSVTELIGEHRSVERALVQVEMPRMSRIELMQIIERGCDHAGLSSHPAATDQIVSLSEGLPHFTHLLGLHAGQRAVQDDRNEITLGDVKVAVDQAVAKHSIRSDYEMATRSAQTDNLYKEVLLACALAPKDQFGFFSAGSIRDALEAVAERRIDIPQFARHLKQFISIERGSILRRVGETRRFFYRFNEPLMQPYVIMTGLSEGLISQDRLKALQGLGDDEPPTFGPPSGQPQLF